MEVLRTPEERFAAVPDFPYEPTYVTFGSGAGPGDGDADGNGDGDGGTLRMAVVDVGPVDGEVVVLLHGGPTWSFLWRRVVPVLTGAGLRVVAPDLIGFGRSDKPADPGAYSYAGHVEWVRQALFDGLGLVDVTLVGHDWGGLIGLRLVAEHPDRFARVVVTNTGLPTGDAPPSEAFLAWQRSAAESPEFDAGRIVAGGCRTPLPPEVVAGYDAPFPDSSLTAGARAFPALVPTRPDDPAAAANRAAWEVLARWEKPFLTAFSDSEADPAGGDAVFQRVVPGARGLPHVTLRGGGHYLQEDVGPELGRVVVDLVAATPLR